MPIAAQPYVQSFDGEDIYMSHNDHKHTQGEAADETLRQLFYENKRKLPTEKSVLIAAFGINPPPPHILG